MPTEIVYTRFYKCPGPNAGPRGHTYESKALANPDDIEKTRKDGGWYETLDAAVEAFDLAKSPEDPSEMASTATPEERAAAAEALQSDAAEKLTLANQALSVDEEMAAVADKALAEATAKCDAATTKKEAAEAEYQAAAAVKDSAFAASQAAHKTLTSAKLRQLAADRALDDAAGKVLTMGSLLTAAKKKALDTAVAKQKALAEAVQKEKREKVIPPDTVDVPPPDPTAPAAPGVRVKGRSL